MENRRCGFLEFFAYTLKLVTEEKEKINNIKFGREKKARRRFLFIIGQSGSKGRKRRG